MGNWNIPEEFRLVELSDYTTWHYASIQDWFDMREKILGKAPSSKEKKKVDRALKKAITAFKKEKGSAFNMKLIHHSGQQVARIQTLFLKYLKADSYVWRSCSSWELEFLRASQWLQHLQDHFDDKDDTGSVIRTLLEMCAQKDHELHDYRTEKNDLKLRSISLQITEKGLPGGKNAYLPDPIELMQLYRLACLIAIELKPQITNARILKLKSDKYGSAFPCRKCHKKYDYAIFAEMCCKKEYSKEKRDQYINSIPVGSPGLKKHVCALLALLWRFGYDTPICFEDLLNWSGWENITKKAAGGFADDLLGYIFKSKPETVRRKLAHGILKNEYEDHGIPLLLQDFKNKKIFGRYAVLSPPHWYRGETAGSNTPAPLNSKCIVIYKWRCSHSSRYELARYLIPESEKSSDA